MATNTRRDSKGGDQHYGLNRDKVETARLHMQHRILIDSLKFLVHPSISINQPDLHIADFATGTGVWLIDVSKIVPPTSKLDGFDISSAQFPSQSTLPPNISLHEHDILKPLPVSYHGRYDLIAVRALVTVLTVEEWDKAVFNLIPLLKQGGWLQWIDPDATPASFKVVAAEAMAPTGSFQTAVALFNEWADLLGRPLNACNRLPEIFSAAGLEEVGHDVMSTDNDPKTRRNFSVELSYGLQPLFERYAQMDSSSLTIEEAKTIGEGMRKETEDGKAYARMEVNIVIGKKPKIA